MYMYMYMCVRVCIVPYAAVIWIGPYAYPLDVARVGRSTDTALAEGCNVHSRAYARRRGRGRGRGRGWASPARQIAQRLDLVAIRVIGRVHHRFKVDGLNA